MIAIIRILLFGLLALITGCTRRNVPQAVVELDPVEKKYQAWMAAKNKAIPEIAEALETKAGDYRLRSNALLAAGKLNATNLAPRAFELLQKAPEQAVRNCALIALADLDYRAAIPYISKLFPGESQAGQVELITLAEQAGRFKAAPLNEKLLPMLKHQNSSLRLAAQNALSLQKDPALVKPLLMLHHQDTSGEWSKEIAAILSTLDHPRAREALLAFLIDADSTGRIAAINGLGELREKRALPALHGILAQARSVDALVRKTAEAIVKIDRPESTAPLFRLCHSESSELRLLAAESLSALSDPAIAPKALALLKQSPVKARAAAAFIAGEKKIRAAIPELRLQYNKHDGELAFFAARALGQLQAREATAELLAGLNRKKEGAWGAAFALGELKEQSAVAPMLQLIQGDDDLTLTKHCVAALGEIGDRSAIQPILDLPESTLLAMGDLAGRALGKLGGPAVLAHVKKNINSSNENEKRLARLTLVHLKEPDGVDFFLDLLEHQDSRTRQAAMVALRKSTGQSLGTEQEWVNWASDR